MKCFKKLFLMFIAIFLISSVTQIKTYPHTFLKNLFKVLKIDDIGFGHVLLHSNWIENMYQYGPGKAPSKTTTPERTQAKSGNDGVANLVRALWFRFDEAFSLQPSQKPEELSDIDVFDSKVFGKLIDLIYKFMLKDQLEQKIIAIDPYGAIKGSLRESKHDPIKIYGELKKIKKEIEQEELLGGEGKFETEIKDYFDVDGENLKEAYEQHEKALKDFRVGIKEIAKEKQELGKAKITDSEKIRKFEEIAKKEYSYRQGIIEALSKLLKVSVGCWEDERLEDQLNDIIKRIKKRKELNKVLFSIKKPFQKVSKEVKNKIEHLKSKIKDIEVEEREFVRNVPGLGSLVRRIKHALETSKGNYVPRTVPGILWGFFFHKIEKLRSVGARLSALDACLDSISPEFKNQVSLSSFYDEKDFEAFEEKIEDMSADEQITEIFDNYDLALHYFINKLAGSFPARILQGSFGFEYEMEKFPVQPVPDCFETSFHDLFSILWYGREEKRFDNKLFSKDILENGEGFKRFREALKYFYLADKDPSIDIKDFSVGPFTSLKKLKSLGKIKQEEVDALELSAIPIDFIKRPEIKQELMNIVSNILQVDYKSSVAGKGFEVYPTIDNFIKVLNYFYGTKAENLEDLGKDLSLEDVREITFISKKVGDQDHIKVSVNDMVNSAIFDMIVEITPNHHAKLSVPARDRVALNILKEGIAQKLLAGVLKDPRYATIFTLLTSFSLFAPDFNLSLPIFNLIYYSIDMKPVDNKLRLIASILFLYPQYYNSFKGIIENLIEKIPIDDDSLFLRLSEMLLKTTLFQEPSIKKFLQLILEKVIAGGSEDLKYKLAKMILEKGFYNKGPFLKTFIQLATVNNDKFFENKANVRDILITSLEVDNDIALKIMEDPRLVNCCSHDLILAIAFKQDNQDFIRKFFEDNPGYKSWADVLSLAIGRGWRDAANKIVQHKNFDASGSPGEAFLAVYKTDWSDVALGLVKGKNFDFDTKYNNAILWALDLGWDDVILACVNHPKFDANGRLAGDILRSAKSLVKEKPERASQLQKIIDTIKQRQREK